MSTIYDYITIRMPNGGEPFTYSDPDMVTFEATNSDKVTSFLIDGLSAKQNATPAPDNWQSIIGNTYVYYGISSTSTGSGNASSKSLGRTVYGGSCDIRTGALTVTYDVITLDSTNFTWTQEGTVGSNRRYYTPITGLKSLSRASYETAKCLCTHAVYKTSGNNAWGNFYFSNGRVYIEDKNGNFNDLAAFTAWLDSEDLAGRSFKICYPLATPVSYTLSTTNPTLKEGANYIKSTSGSMTITFRRVRNVIRRPSNFLIQREDIYSGVYTTCTGATRADKIGWKYSDMKLEWEALRQDDVEKLFSIEGETYLIFDDPLGDQITEQIMRSSVVSMRDRFTENGVHWWRDVSCDISFVETHQDEA